MASYAGPELVGLAELPAWPSVFVMHCPPPLTPPSQGGERARSLALSFDRAPKTRISKPSPQYGQQELFISPGQRPREC